MKFRSTILLLAVALGIGAYIWFVEKSQLSTDEREEKEKLVFSVKADEIDRVELVRERTRSFSRRLRTAPGTSRSRCSTALTRARSSPSCAASRG